MSEQNEGQQDGRIIHITEEVFGNMMDILGDEMRKNVTHMHKEPQTSLERVVNAWMDNTTETLTILCTTLVDCTKIIISEDETLEDETLEGTE